jgi:hypothetical protein
MATRAPTFRLTIYAPKVEDSTEATVMTPVAGAAHSDQFIVTTVQGVTGAQPYLGMPKGRQGSFDPITKRTTVGNLSLAVFDPRTAAGGANANRWSTAFLGDLKGNTRLKGCKFVLEQLNVNGSTWDAYFAGRIRNYSARAQWLDLDLASYAEDLKRRVFIGAPDASASYAAPAALLPIGISQAFGNLTSTPPLTGTLVQDNATFARITLDVTQDPRMALVTKAARDAELSLLPSVAVVKNMNTATTNYFALSANRFGAGPTLLISAVKGGASHNRYQVVEITPLPTTDPRYAPLPTGSVPVQVRVYADAPATKDLPILVNNVHPIQFFADLIDGKFSRVPGLNTLRPLALRDTSGGSAWTTMLADASFGTDTFVIDSAAAASDFIEKYICQPHNIGYRFDAAGRIVPIDLRRTAALASAQTLTDADLVSDVEPAWNDTRDAAITAVNISYYTDRSVTSDQIDASSEEFPAWPPSMVISAKNSVLFPVDLSTLRDVGERVIEIDAIGTRIAESSAAQNVSAVRAFVESNVAAIARDLARPFVNGAAKARATYRILGGAATVTQGMYCLVQHTKLPDPATNTRGGARLMLCLSRDEIDGRVAIEWLDCGAANTATAPTVSLIAAVASSAGAPAVDVSVTVNASGDTAEVQRNVTTTAIAVRPAATDAGWVSGGEPLIASGTLRVLNMASGARVWIRARSQGKSSSLKIPSDWAFPVSPAGGYVDMAALSPASGVIASNLLANRVDLSWTLPSTDKLVELYMTTGGVPAAWTSAMSIQTMLAGTTQTRVGFLTTLTQYSFGVGVRDKSGGVSSIATITLTTTNTLGLAPIPVALDFAVGGVSA